MSEEKWRGGNTTREELLAYAAHQDRQLAEKDARIAALEAERGAFEAQAQAQAHAGRRLMECVAERAADLGAANARVAELEAWCEMRRQEGDQRERVALSFRDAERKRAEKAETALREADALWSSKDNAGLIRDLKAQVAALEDALEQAFVDFSRIGCDPVNPIQQAASGMRAIQEVLPRCQLFAARKEPEQ